MKRGDNSENNANGDNAGIFDLNDGLVTVWHLGSVLGC